MPQNITLTIRKVKPNNELVIVPARNIIAEPGDTITWTIANNSGVTAITAIRPKSGSPNIFNPDPARVAGSTNWQGIIASRIFCGIEEDYSIEYTTTSGSSVDDPKISILPSDSFVTYIKKIILPLFCLVLGIFSARFFERKKLNRIDR